MLISKRRLKWGGMLLLLGAAFLLVQPIRGWVDNALVQRFDPDLKVSAIKFHPSASVVELKQLEWSKLAANRQFGFKCDQAWLALDQEALTKGQLLIGRGEVENAELYFTTYTPFSWSENSRWQLELDQATRLAEWESLAGEFIQKLNTPEISSNVRQRIDRWLQRSQEISLQAQRISSEFRSGNNPLRFEDELRRKLNVLGELSRQHAAVVMQFEGFSSEVLEQCGVLQDELQNRAKLLRRDTLTQLSGSESEARIAEAILIELAEAKWSRLADCGQIAQLIASSMSVEERRDYDHDVLVGGGSSRFVDLKGLKVEGTFRDRSESIPFRLLTHLTYDQHYRNELNSHWRYYFQGKDSVVEVHADQLADQNELAVDVSLRLPNLAEAQSPSDDHAPYTAATYSNVPAKLVSWDVMGTEDLNNQLASLSVDSDPAGILDGVFRIRVTAADALSEDCGDILADAMNLNSDACFEYEFSVAGSWQEPKFVLNQEVSPNLLAAIKRHIDGKAASSNEEAIKRAIGSFEREVDDLLSFVKIAIDSASPTLTRNRKELDTIFTSLQRNLDSMTGGDFTRDDYLGVPIR